MPYQIVEPGSLDIEDAHVCLGGIETDDLPTLQSIYSDYNQRGNKFVTAEVFVNNNGLPLEAEQFDVRQMCYGMFVAPIRDGGRHYNVIPYNQRKGFSRRIGAITGGGLVRIAEEKTVVVDNLSGDYRREPDYLRAKFAALLLAELRLKLGEPELKVAERTLNATSFYDFGVNRYWLRYRQVLDAAQAKLDRSEFAYELGEYNRNQQAMEKVSSQTKQ